MSIFRRLFDRQGYAAERELERRISAFRAEVTAARATTTTIEEVSRLRERAAALELSEDDVALELEIVDGLVAVLRLKADAAAGRPLPLVESNHRALAGEPCHFLAPAFRPDVANDAGGKLFFTPRRLLYIGASGTSMSWAHVAQVRDVDRDLAIHARPNMLRTFRCNSYVDTLRGAYIGSRLVSR